MYFDSIVDIQADLNTSEFGTLYIYPISETSTPVVTINSAPYKVDSLSSNVARGWRPNNIDDYRYAAVYKLTYPDGTTCWGNQYTSDQEALASMGLK